MTKQPEYFVQDEKGNPLWVKFSQTAAYSKLFMELATDADAGAKFVNGIMPAGYANAENKIPLPQVDN